MVWHHTDGSWYACMLLTALLVFSVLLKVSATLCPLSVNPKDEGYLLHAIYTNKNTFKSKLPHAQTQACTHTVRYTQTIPRVLLAYQIDLLSGISQQLINIT